MITRRNALKIAAGLTAGRLGLSAVTPAEAATLLDQPLDAGDPLTVGVTAPKVFDPVAFAEHAYGGMDGDNVTESLMLYIAPHEYAAYKQTHVAVNQALPFLVDLKPFDHPWHLLSEHAFNWAMECYHKGLADGAAFEHLRQALTGPERGCPRCDGVGTLGAEGGFDHYLTGTQSCPDCKGRGIIPSTLPAAGLQAA